MTKLLRHIASSMATIVVIAPSRKEYRDAAHPNGSSVESMRKDWENVGRDITTAYQKIANDK